MSDMNTLLRQAVQGPQAERRRVFHDRHVAAIEEKLRRAYLGSDPTTTEDDFQRSLPELRDALRRRRVLGDATG